MKDTANCTSVFHFPQKSLNEFLKGCVRLSDRDFYGRSDRKGYSVGEFAEVMLPFRQYPVSQTDLLAFFLCQETHLLSSVCQLTRILCFFCMCASVNHGAAVCQCWWQWGWQGAMPVWQLGRLLLTLSKSTSRSPAGWALLLKHTKTHTYCTMFQFIAHISTSISSSPEGFQWRDSGTISSDGALVT